MNNDKITNRIKRKSQKTTDNPQKKLIPLINTGNLFIA